MTEPETSIRTAELSALGLRTRVLETGPAESSEAVVLLHGGPGSADDWRGLLPRVGELARAVAFDLPGFGEADKPASWEYSFSAFAIFIAAALNQLGIARAHLVMGDIGSAGAFWAASHPDAFASVVVVNGGVLVGYRWHALARLHRMPVVGRLVAAGARPALPTAMRIYNRGGRELPADVVERWRRDYDWGTRRAMLRFYRSTQPAGLARLAPVLRALDRPALVIWGAKDRFTPADQAERQRQSFPSAEVVMLERSGHYPHLDDPDAVAQAVVPFLRRQLAA